jgi:hypothetical protein
MITVVLATACNERSASALPGPAPPRPSYNVSGVVLELTGQPIRDAAVTQWGQTVLTDAAGRYAFTAPSGLVSIHVSKAGYETRTYDLAVDRDREYDVVLRRAVVIAAGESATVTFDARDGAYEFPRVYELCEAPCKLVRIEVPVRGTLSITVTTVDGQLSVFTRDGSTQRCCAAQVTITGEPVEAGEFLFHVNVSGADRADPRATISTAFAAR